MGNGRYAIETKNLSKEYDGIEALKDVSFKVKRGDVVGYLGPNGAGKTTTIKLMTNLLKPTSGSVYINGINVTKNPTKALSYVGALIEVPGMYDYLTPHELMIHQGRVYRMGKEKIKRRIRQVMKTVKLKDWEHTKIDDFSTGMRRRLAIGLALLPSPKILILDEPVMGLDPEGIKEVRELIKRLREREITIFLSSHLLQEVSLTCNKVIIILDGEMKAYNDIDKIVGDLHDQKITVEFLEKLTDDEIERLRKIENFEKVEVEGNRAVIFNGKEKKNKARILSTLIQEGFEVVSYSCKEKELEDFYINLVEQMEDN